MGRFWPTFGAVPLVVLSLGAAGVVGPLCHAAHAQSSVSSGNKSWTDSITSPFKQGFDKLGRALTPKPSLSEAGSEDDALSLKSKGKPGAELYVAIARLYEQSGKVAEAEQQYQLALEDKDKPNHLPALLGSAHLKDFLGKPDEAIQLYQRAIKAYPQQASVYNDFGLYHARHNRLDEAAAALSRAAELDPKNPLYRNNIATVLVDQGKLREAFGQLRAVHTNAAAYYNMGYLLNKKGQTQAAIQHFTLALRADPSMDAAKMWVEYLQRRTAQARVPQNPAPSMKTTRRPATFEDDGPSPRRLPPTIMRDSASDGPALPGISYERSAAPSAPLPPPSASPALQPLPRVN